MCVGFAAQYMYDKHIDPNRKKKSDATAGPSETNNSYINDLESRSEDTAANRGGRSDSSPGGYKNDPTR